MYSGFLYRGKTLDECTRQELIQIITILNGQRDNMHSEHRELEMLRSEIRTKEAIIKRIEATMQTKQEES